MICFDLTIDIKGDIKNLKKLIINVENLEDIFWRSAQLWVWHSDSVTVSPAAVPNLI